ncbi:hypothetical protein UlMin_028090 [Ulmus minor]
MTFVPMSSLYYLNVLVKHLTLQSYVNQAPLLVLLTISRYIQQHNEVELSALGMAMTTVVTITKILKNKGLAIEKKVSTSTVGMKDENKGRLIEIVLGKSEKFDSLMTATVTAASEQANNEKVDQQ